MAKPQLLEMGDVIKGDLSWTFTSYNEHDNSFNLNQVDVTAFDSSKPRVTGFYTQAKPVVAPDSWGWPPMPKEITLLERIEAAGIQLNQKQFVVVETQFSGGGNGGYGPQDNYEDGWHIVAKALNDDGSYNPDGLKIQFYQTGSFNCKIEDVKPVAKMRQTFVPIEP